MSTGRCHAGRMCACVHLVRTEGPVCLGYSMMVGLAGCSPTLEVSKTTVLYVTLQTQRWRRDPESHWDIPLRRQVVYVIDVSRQSGAPGWLRSSICSFAGSYPI